jgi:hypothetical protein
MSLFLVFRVKGKGNTLRREYVLPDGVKHKRGFVKEPELEPESKKIDLP